MPIDTNGYSNLQQGTRLFQQGQYDQASNYLWRAVLLHSQNEHSSSYINNGVDVDDRPPSYTVDEAFAPFLQCYLRLHKLVDGLVFISAESFARGQFEMGELYLRQALERDAGHEEGRRLEKLIFQDATADGGKSAIGKDTLEKLKEIRDRVDASNPKNGENNNNNNNAKNGDEAFWDQFKDNSNDLGSNQAQTHNNDIDSHLADKTPEDLYNLGTHYFNTKNLPYASHLFELSCQKSNAKLSPACTNAVYLRTNLCDWGENGKGFEKDMKIIEKITRAEVELYRFVLDGEFSEEQRRQVGMRDTNTEGIIQWKRATSVHPHMMLGYSLSNENAILKRYVAEGMASLDEVRARFSDDGVISERPSDLPYSVKEMRKKYQKQMQQQPIKVGFVACGFNSKAVLYLSHDIFRFFDPSLVEIHIFSTGPPDHPNFIHGTMRGVDWRQRVIDTVDYFHDVRRYQGDHIGLARYIHKQEIQILIEWDGYARQGERAAGLMALRPCPVQILHQEFLMTSGAQYIDYIITDKVTSPLRLEHLYTEKFLYLPNHFFSKGHAVQKEVVPPSFEYIPKEDKDAPFQLGVGSPQVNACLSSNPLGSDNHEDVSFVYCNFNKFLKHNPQTMRSWMRILQEVPNSILCLLENPIEGIPNLRKFVSEATASPQSDGIEGNVFISNINDRIHFLQWEQNPFDHQRRTHSLCNVMLDSHPYNGHTTAQDALYAGVPIVTRSDGDDMSSRVSTSANVVLGLEELNAYNGINEYEDIAIRLGNDETWFSTIRSRLIATCLQKNPMHPYWDVPRYVRAFERGLQMIWESFLDGSAPDHVEVVEVEGAYGCGNISGTTEEELVARETKRIYTKKNLLIETKESNARSEL